MPAFPSPSTASTEVAGLQAFAFQLFEGPVHSDGNEARTLDRATWLSWLRRALDPWLCAPAFRQVCLFSVVCAQGPGWVLVPIMQPGKLCGCMSIVPGYAPGWNKNMVLFKLIPQVALKLHGQVLIWS